MPNDRSSPTLRHRSLIRRRRRWLARVRAELTAALAAGELLRSGDAAAEAIRRAILAIDEMDARLARRLQQYPQWTKDEAGQ